MTSPTSPASFSLQGEVALITGGGTGLGLGIARCIAQAGARVVLVGRRAAELATAAESIGANASYISHDITRKDEAAQLIAAAAEKAAAPVSILVNNAGIHLKKLAVETSPDEFANVFDTHLFSAHALSAAVLPGMMERGHGSIIFISSMAAYMGVPRVAAYAAAKSACFGMVSTLSAECSASGVRVNAIAPGWIYSDMSAKALDSDPARKARVMGRIQMSRMGQPEDIGWAAVYLCSPAAAYVTGVTLPVDGGAVVAF